MNLVILSKWIGTCVGPDDFRFFHHKVFRFSEISNLIDNAKLVIIDGIISLHRAEFAGRGTLADRQQRLNGMLHKIIRLAEIFNIAVVITNQVQAAPDTFFGDPTKAAGGNVVAHSSTYRIYLRKSGENRVAKMMHSPYHPYSDSRFELYANPH
jgi:DNA repair protein RadA